VRLTTSPPSCALVMKSGNLNFLEPSEPLQACNGTALLFIINNHDKLTNSHVGSDVINAVFSVGRTETAILHNNGSAFSSSN
jgi:hypothetical protein